MIGSQYLSLLLASVMTWKGSPVPFLFLSQSGFYNSCFHCSVQWWPGGLGKVATHAIAYARLIVGGREHGVNGNYKVCLYHIVEIGLYKFSIKHQPFLMQKQQK